MKLRISALTKIKRVHRLDELLGPRVGLARNDVDKSRKMIPFLSSATALTEVGGRRWFLRNRKT